ncbi:MAG: hypothetical protein IT324_01505 [Anaerolineae bacterium]|nr:hypothetical protein [Anaerolineae bacterium]
MAQPVDVILDLSVEGGRTTILGRQVAPDQWRFCVTSNNMDLDEQDVEVWRANQTAEGGTLATAIHLLGKNWILMYRLAAHPAFAAQIWEAVQQCIPPPDDYRLAIWMRHRSRWEAILRGNG